MTNVGDKKMKDGDGKRIVGSDGSRRGIVTLSDTMTKMPVYSVSRVVYTSVVSLVRTRVDCTIHPIAILKKKKKIEPVKDTSKDGVEFMLVECKTMDMNSKFCIAMHACFGIVMSLKGVETAIESGECGIRGDDGTVIQPVDHKTLTPTHTDDAHTFQAATIETATTVTSGMINSDFIVIEDDDLPLSFQSRRTSDSKSNSLSFTRSLHSDLSTKPADSTLTKNPTSSRKSITSQIQSIESNQLSIASTTSTLSTIAKSIAASIASKRITSQWCRLFLTIPEVSGLSPIYPQPTLDHPLPVGVIIRQSYEATLQAKLHAYRDDRVMEWHRKTSGREATRRVWEMNEVIAKARLLCAWVDQTNANPTNSNSNLNASKDANSKEDELSFSESESDDSNSETDSDTPVITKKNSMKSQDTLPILAPGLIYTLSDTPIPTTLQQQQQTTTSNVIDDSLYSENSMIQTHLAKSRMVKAKKATGLVELNADDVRKSERSVDLREGKMYEDMVGLGETYTLNS